MAQPFPQIPALAQVLAVGNNANGTSIKLDGVATLSSDSSGNMTFAGESLSLNIVGAIGTPNSTLDNGAGLSTLVGLVISGSRLSFQNIPVTPQAQGEIYSNAGVLTISP